MDSADLLQLLGGDDASSAGMASVMDRRAKAAQGAGLLLRTLTGDRDPTGGALLQQGTHDQDLAAKAVQDRPEYQLQGVKARQAQAEEQAWQDPAARQVLQGAIRSFMPGLQVDEKTPTQVLRNILPTAEKFGQSYNALQLRQALHGYQVKNDPATGETFQYDPITGASYHMDGTPRSKPLRGPLLPPARAPAAPMAAPTPAEATPPASKASKGPLVQPGAAGAAGQLQSPRLFGKVLQKGLDQLTNDFDPSKGGGGEFGKNQQRVNAATRLLQLAQNPDGTPANLTPNQMPELAQALASLISGSGSGAQAQIEHLTPTSLRGDMAKTMQWLFNEPTGADQQAFVHNMIDTAKREQAVAQQGIEKVRDQRWARNQRVIRGNPEEARQVLNGFGWDLGPDGKPMLMPASPTPAAHAAPAMTSEDQAAKAWADAHASDPRAAKILERLKAKGL